MTSRAALDLMGLTKEKILGAGLKILDEVGLDRFSVEMVAAQCAVTPSSIYKYFRDVDDFHDALTAGALAMLIDVHRDINLDRTGREALEAYALVERAYGQAHPALYSAALRGPRGPSAELKLLRQTYMSITITMLRGYDIPRPVAPEIANCLSAALQGFVSAEISGRGRNGLEFDRNYERLLDMLDAGARAARPQPARPPQDRVAHRQAR